MAKAREVVLERHEGLSGRTVAERDATPNPSSPITAPRSVLSSDRTGATIVQLTFVPPLSGALGQHQRWRVREDLFVHPIVPLARWQLVAVEG